MKKIFNRNYYNEKHKKGDIAFKFSFPLMLCINVLTLNQKLVYLLKERKGDKEISPVSK